MIFNPIQVKLHEKLKQHVHVCMLHIAAQLNRRTYQAPRMSSIPPYEIQCHQWTFLPKNVQIPWNSIHNLELNFLKKPICSFACYPLSKTSFFSPQPKFRQTQLSHKTFRPISFHHLTFIISPLNYTVEPLISHLLFGNQKSSSISPDRPLNTPEY